MFRNFVRVVQIIFKKVFQAAFLGKRGVFVFIQVYILMLNRHIENDLKKNILNFTARLGFKK